MELLLLWKGDTFNALSGSSNPEESVAHMAHNATHVSTTDEGQTTLVVTYKDSITHMMIGTDQYSMHYGTISTQY